VHSSRKNVGEELVERAFVLYPGLMEKRVPFPAGLGSSSSTHLFLQTEGLETGIFIQNTPVVFAFSGKRKHLPVPSVVYVNIGKYSFPCGEGGVYADVIWGKRKRGKREIKSRKSKCESGN
jgi:hypothetical protein